MTVGRLIELLRKFEEHDTVAIAMRVHRGDRDDDLNPIDLIGVYQPEGRPPMIDVRFVYLDRPRDLAEQACRFRASYRQTLNLLEKELNHLSAVAIVVQAGFPQHCVRNDGWPYANAKPLHPAVVLQFRSGKDTLTFRAVTYSSFDDNLRAIAMTLSALRAIDRYGVVQGQQYAGFKQIGSAPDPKKQPMSWAHAVSWLGLYTAQSSLVFTKNREALDEAYRNACKKTHPDTGGSHEAFLETQEAYRVLREALG